jgi:hypothetical protein
MSDVLYPTCFLQVIGPVVDVRFDGDNLPDIMSCLVRAAHSSNSICSTAYRSDMQRAAGITAAASTTVVYLQHQRCMIAHGQDPAAAGVPHCSCAQTMREFSLSCVRRPAVCIA